VWLRGPAGAGRHNGEVPERNRLTVTRAAAVVALSGLALAGCSSPDHPEAGKTPSLTSSASPSPSTTVSVAPSQHLTAQGSNLSFGDTATVVFEPTKRKGSVLELTVKDARRGKLSDFKAFTLDDAYKRKAHYYYVDVTVKNVGEGDVGGVPVPLWGVNADNVLLPAVSFTTTFKKCPSKPLPKKFGPGDEVDSCLVYLSPDKGTLEAVSFRPSQEFNPIQWKGTVESPQASPSKKARKKG
jgi:hypothetical protein